MARREYEIWDGIYSRKEENLHALSFEDSVLPLIRAEKAVLVDDDWELEKGVWLEPCHGHTMGNVVINIKSGDAHAVFSGDVIHHQIQLHFPQLSCRADTDMDLSRKTRRALIEKHADTGNILIPAHFPMPTAGRVESSGDAFRFVGA
jgi:glyoxylase-like metal-dependent hydrolase (beta-lactamase superfamily II)